MEDETRKRLVSILTDAAVKMLPELRTFIPGVQLKCDHYKNPTIELAAFAIFSTESTVVTLSVGVQREEGRYRLTGDISYEDGGVIADIVDLCLDSEAQLIHVVTRYVADCSARLAQIGAALNELQSD